MILYQPVPIWQIPGPHALHRTVFYASSACTVSPVSMVQGQCVYVHAAPEKHTSFSFAAMTADGTCVSESWYMLLSC